MQIIDWNDRDWVEAAERQGHVLKLDEDGVVDWFVLDEGFHNGPTCTRCEEVWCEHCTSPDDIEPCKAVEND